jgi:hypothetical protein
MLAQGSFNLYVKRERLVFDVLSDTSGCYQEQAEMAGHLMIK